MNIGIITWFGGPNYGTNLQAISLQKYLRKVGYSVQIINYVPPRVGYGKELSIWDRIAHQPQKYVNLYSKGKYKQELEQKNNKIQESLCKHCKFTAQITNDEEYVQICNDFDVLVFGSDQIWNPNWYHPWYYADNPIIKAKRVSYAPSMGVTSLEPEIAEKIRHSLEVFSAVSIREIECVNLLEQCMGIRPETVLDPTFLLNREDWSQFIGKEQVAENEYVLSLFLTDNCCHWWAASKLAKKERIKHIVVPYSGFSYLLHADVRADTGLEDLLSLIRGAKFVLTDSYHVTVFSLIFNKEFYVFARFKDADDFSQNSRVTNLLDSINLIERLIPYGSRTINLMNPIDYGAVNHILEMEKKKSRQYLRNALLVK